MQSNLITSDGYTWMQKFVSKFCRYENFGHLNQSEHYETYLNKREANNFVKLYYFQNFCPYVENDFFLLWRQ